MAEEPGTFHMFQNANMAQLRHMLIMAEEEGKTELAQQIRSHMANINKRKPVRHAQTLLTSGGEKK